MSPRLRRSLYEGGHKVDIDEPTQFGDDLRPPTKDGQRRVLNEAAHKLETLGEQPEAEKPAPREFEAERDVVPQAGRAALALAALGVVFGDIGTSPLYTEQVIFTTHRAAAQTNVAGVYGIVSLIFWSLLIVVSFKYAGLIMRAHNRGDGGILALTALIRRCRPVHGLMLVLLGIFGASLFLGDGMITPAISVLSAVEGLKVAEPGVGHLVMPIALAILVSLFLIQRRGTGAVGALFGPVMLVWFSVLAILGIHGVVQHPGVFEGLSPTYGARFMADHGGAAFLTLGSVVLAVTGAEALYADRGHFGTSPIRLSWFAIVLPGVLLCYLGQAALILTHPATIRNPFYLLVPSWGRFPMVFLASAATIIASQAVISGSYSVAKQAVQLGFLPRLKITHTSREAGQIYVPAVNWALCIGVVALVLGFQRSSRLAEIYGVAVTGTFILDTILFLVVGRTMWSVAKWKLALVGQRLAARRVVVLQLEHRQGGAWGLAPAARRRSRSRWS